LAEVGGGNKGRLVRICQAVADIFGGAGLLHESGREEEFRVKG
jgi:hypothetical protein